MTPRACSMVGIVLYIMALAVIVALETTVDINLSGVECVAHGAVRPANWLFIDALLTGATILILTSIAYRKNAIYVSVGWTMLAILSYTLYLTQAIIGAIVLANTTACMDGSMLLWQSMLIFVILRLLQSNHIGLYLIHLHIGSKMHDSMTINE